MSGVNLKELGAADFIDALHFLFEDYFTFVSEEHVGSASGIRKSVWNNLYGQDFKYEVKTRSQEKASRTPGGMSSASGYQASYEDADFSDLDSVDPFSPRQRSENGEEIKPFIPATDFNPDSANPFPGLDGPLG